MKRPLLPLLFAMLGCAPQFAGSADDEDASDGGSTDGGSADGGDADGGATDGGSADGGSIDDRDPEDVPGVEDPNDRLFDQVNLPVFEVGLSDASYSALIADPYTYVEGSFTWEGVTYEPVGVRTKGQNSWRPLNEKASLKIKFDKYDETGNLHGIREVTLNAGNDDLSLLHERLAYLMYREAGVPAARATHATVYINGENFGIYTHLETVDKNLLKRWYDDPDGSLFEQWDVDYISGYAGVFELETGPDDRTAIQGVIDAMALSTAQARYDAASEYLDWEQFTLYWAVGAYVGQFDAYPYSSPGDDCHIYVDPSDGRIDYIPHGVDETFYYPDHNVFYNAIGTIAATCKAVTECYEMAHQKTFEVTQLAEDIGFHATFLEIQEQAAPLIAADTHTGHSRNEIEYYQDVMEGMIVNRRSALVEQIGEPSR